MYLKTHVCYILIDYMQNLPALVAQSIGCPPRGTGGHGIDPGQRHTKVIKMVLHVAAPRLALRLTG